MSEANNVEDVKKQEVHEDSSNNQASDKDANNESMPSPQQEVIHLFCSIILLLFNSVFYLI